MVPTILPTLSHIHHIALPIIIFLPYYYLYLCMVTSSAVPAHPNLASLPPDTGKAPTELDFGSHHRRTMLVYPYDYLIFHPGYFCNTCRVPKPARSKHCSLCKCCIQKSDHHCIWINNCVGRNNYLYFLLLLITITILLSYGVYLGYTFVDAVLQKQLVPPELTRGSLTNKHWRTRLDWGQMMHAYSIALILHPRVVATTLLCTMCTPLSSGFLIYHAYLLWAGMTTNETQKWSEWREDIDDGIVFRAKLDTLRSFSDDPVSEHYSDEDTSQNNDRPHEEDPGWLPEQVEPRPWDVNWPPKGSPRWWWNSQQIRCKPQWWYVRTREGQQPMKKEGGREVVDERWERVGDLRKDVENVYDLGLWGNLWEVVWNRE